MNEPTTETIEWRKLPDETPKRQCEVLMRVDGCQSHWRVIHGLYTKKRGFESVWGNQYQPTHWAYMPKGPK